MKSLSEFAATATIAQEVGLIKAIATYYPSIRVYATRGGGERHRKLFWRDHEIKTSRKRDLILGTAQILCLALRHRRRGVPGIVRFFNENLGWDCANTPEMLSRLSPETENVYFKYGV